MRFLAGEEFFLAALLKADRQNASRNGLQAQINLLVGQLQGADPGTVWRAWHYRLPGFAANNVDVMPVIAPVDLDFLSAHLGGQETTATRTAPKPQPIRVGLMPMSPGQPPSPAGPASCVDQLIECPPARLNVPHLHFVLVEDTTR